MAWHRHHALHGVCQLGGQLTIPHRDPQVPAWYTKLRPRAVRPNPTDSVLRNQVGYTGPRETTSRRDGRASQETSHRRAVRTWDRPQSCHTRSWAVKYLDQCLCPTAADPGAQQVACSNAVHTGGTSPRSRYATPPPPPLPALRANLVAKGQQLLAIHIVAPKALEIFFSFALPILSTLHPNIILEPNLDSNAHPNPQPTPNPTPKPFP